MLQFSPVDDRVLQEAHIPYERYPYSDYTNSCSNSSFLIAGGHLSFTYNDMKTQYVCPSFLVPLNILKSSILKFGGYDTESTHGEYNLVMGVTSTCLSCSRTCLLTISA